MPWEFFSMLKQTKFVVMASYPLNIVQNTLLTIRNIRTVIWSMGFSFIGDVYGFKECERRNQENECFLTAR
jgi:hypothetical protein